MIKYDCLKSFPGSPDGQVALDVLLHHLGHCHLEVLLGHVDTTLPQGKHTRLGADCLRLCPRGPHHLLADPLQVNSPHQVHLPRVDF